MEQYTDTSSRLAREAEAAIPTINLYAKLGLLDFVVASNGIRLFRQGQSSKVRQIREQRLARRFGRSAA